MLFLFNGFNDDGSTRSTVDWYKTVVVIVGLILGLANFWLQNSGYYNQNLLVTLFLLGVVGLGFYVWLKSTFKYRLYALLTFIVLSISFTGVAGYSVWKASQVDTPIEIVTYTKDSSEVIPILVAEEGVSSRSFSSSDVSSSLSATGVKVDPSIDVSFITPTALVTFSSLSLSLPWFGSSYQLLLYDKEGGYFLYRNYL